MMWTRWTVNWLFVRFISSDCQHIIVWWTYLRRRIISFFLSLARVENSQKKLTILRCSNNFQSSNWLGLGQHVDLLNNHRWHFTRVICWCGVYRFQHFSMIYCGIKGKNCYELGIWGKNDNQKSTYWMILDFLSIFCWKIFHILCTETHTHILYTTSVWNF